MRLRTALAAALVLVTIGAAATSRPTRPVGSAHSSALVSATTPIPTPVMSTLRRACFDCHSDETRWPWYAALPVASHLIVRDVTEGRGQVNLSRWTEYNPFDRMDMLDKMCKLASTGQMPPWQYRLMHFDARLSTTDVAAMCVWSQDEATRLMQGGT
jgi:Haem-binding domain